MKKIIFAALIIFNISILHVFAISQAGSFYVIVNSVKYGPVSTETVKQWHQEKRINDSTMIIDSQTQQFYFAKDLLISENKPNNLIANPGIPPVSINPTSKTAQFQKGKNSILLSLGYFMPSDSWFDFDNSFQYGLGYEYRFSSQVSLISDYFYSSSKSKYFWYSQYSPNSSDKIKGEFSAITLGVKYAFTDKNNFRPYGFIGLSNSRLKLVLSGMTDSAKKTGFYGGLGFEYPVSKSVYIGLMGDYRSGEDSDIKLGGTSLQFKCGFTL